MVANTNRYSRRPSGIPRYHADSDHQVSRHQTEKLKNRKAALSGAGGSKVPSTGKDEPERAAAATGKQILHPMHQEFRKERVLSKRRKFESLMADMRAKKTIPPGSHNMEMDNANKPSQFIFKDNTITTKLHSHEARRLAGNSSCFRTADHFLLSKADIRRTLSHESGRSDGSPFAKLMATSISSPKPQIMFQSTGPHFSMLGLAGSETQIDGIDLQEPRRYRPHDTYNSLQSLRQKARRNLEKLGLSSRTVPLDHPPSTTSRQDGSKRICAAVKSGDSNVTGDSPRLAHGFILGSCSSLLVKEKQKHSTPYEKEKEKEEAKEQQQIEVTVPLPEGPRENSILSRPAYLANPSQIPSSGSSELYKESKPSSRASSGYTRGNRSVERKQQCQVKPPKCEIENIVVKTVEVTSRSGCESDLGDSHEGNKIKEHSLHEGGSKKMGRRNCYSKNISEDYPSRTTAKNVEAEIEGRRQLRQSSPPASHRYGETYDSRRNGGKDGGKPMVITIYDSELEEKRMRLPSQSNTGSSHPSCKAAPTTIFDCFQKDVDKRILKLRSKLGGRKDQFNEPQRRKVSTFVQDMKQGKNLKESLRHLRQTAKNKRREEIRARRKDNDEIVFRDATKGETANYKKGNARNRTPPKTALHEVIRAPMLSPITIDVALAQEQSSCASYTSARSDCMAKATAVEDILGAEIKCSDHSVLADQEKTELTVACQDSSGISSVGGDVIDGANYTANGALKSWFTRGVRKKESSGTSGIVLSGSKSALVSRKKTLASSVEVERVLSAASPKPEEYFTEGFPKQISHLLQTAGSQLGPLVPRGMLAMPEPRSPPSKPEWTTRKDDPVEDGVKNLTDSMGLLLSGGATLEARKNIVNDKPLELNLRLIEQRVQNRATEESSLGEQNTALGLYLQKGQKSQAKRQVGADFCLTKKNAEAERNFEIVSSSPIISKFLKRKDQGSRHNFPCRTNLDSQRACSPASLAWDTPKNKGSSAGTLASPLTIPVGGVLDGEQSALVYKANADVYPGQHFFSQGMRPKSLSVELLENKRAFFGRAVSPLTLPSVVGKAAIRYAATKLPPKVPTNTTIDSSNTASPIFNGNNATNNVYQAGGQDQRYRSLCSSKSGPLSTLTKHPQRSTYCLSTLGESTQTRPSEGSFLTSIVVRDTVLEKMSSVSDSEETSQLEEETTESASAESSSHASQKLDPPSIRPLDPSAAGNGSEQNNSEMSYSMDSKGESAATDFHTAASSYPHEPVAMSVDIRGNPLKRLLSRPRFPRRQPRPTHLKRLSVSDESSCISHSFSREELAEQYAALRQNPGQLGQNALVNQEDATDDELIRFQSWIGNCGGDPPGLQKSGMSIGPSPPSHQITHIDNVDNLVLASWGIKNRMDRLRASLTFSPGYSYSRTLSSLAVTPKMAISLANVEDSEIHDNVFAGDTGAFSSVSESSTYSTYGDDVAEISRASFSDADAHKIGMSRTMESDRAYFRGTMGSGADTPKSMLAFKSKSWKLDEDDATENSLVASLPSAPSNVSDSGNASSGEYGWKV